MGKCSRHRRAGAEPPPENVPPWRSWSGWLWPVSERGGELLLDLDRLYTMNRFDLVQFPEALEEVGADGCFEWFLDHLLKPPEERRAVLWSELQNSYLNMALSLEALQDNGPGDPGDLGSPIGPGSPCSPGAP